MSISTSRRRPLLVGVLLSAATALSATAAGAESPASTDTTTPDTESSETTESTETSSTDDETGGTTAATTASSGTVLSHVPEGEPDPDATFVYAYPIGVSRLDPHRASISQDGTTLFPAYDRIVHLTPDGELVPGLAESWEFSDDGLTLTLHVREGVTFHDGAELDGEAVRVNLDRALSIEGSSVATDLAAIESVEVTDPMTVTITLSEPNVAIIGSFADRAGILVSPQAIADGVNLDAEMVGAGPYRMVEHRQGDITVYERFDDYWDQDHVAKVARLEIRVLPDANTRLNALRTGEIHATTISSSQVPEVENQPGIAMLFSTELQYFYIVENRARANQDDVRVRQALLYGLDRESICEAVFFGYCELTDQPFPPGYFAYNEEIDDVLYPYDPERAQELMDEAGVGPLTFSMLTPAGLPQYPEVAQIIQAQWAELGVTLEIREAVPTELGELMFAQESADTMLATWGGRPDPAMTFIQRAGPDAYANPGGVTTPAMEDLIHQAMSTVDPEERAAVLQAGSREMAESVLEMVVVFPQVPYAMVDNVAFTPYLTSKPEFRDVAVMQG